MKKCSKCNVVKGLSEFYNDCIKKDGKQSHCKLCNSAMNKQRYIINKEKFTQYYQDNKERHKKQASQWYIDNLDYKKQKMKQWHLTHPDRSKYLSKQFKLNNPEYQKNYILNNPNSAKQYKTNKLRVDSLFKLSCNTRSLIYDSFKR